MGFAVFGIRDILPGMHANRAMYQTIATLREARMLAMSQNRSVSVQFVENNMIQVLIRDVPVGSTGWGADVWHYVRDIAERSFDPSVTFERGYQFTRNAVTLDTPDGVGGNAGDLVFGGSIVAVGTAHRFVFTPDGFLTNVNDLDDPVNGTIFIGLPGGATHLTRAVTILGTTGRIRAWRWRDGAWHSVE
jgi:hypothetical protein